MVGGPTVAVAKFMPDDDIAIPAEPRQAGVI
jgi:hypothetical protein